VQQSRGVRLTPGTLGTHPRTTSLQRQKGTVGTTLQIIEIKQTIPQIPQKLQIQTGAVSKGGGRVDPRR